MGDTVSPAVIESYPSVMIGQIPNRPAVYAYIVCADFLYRTLWKMRHVAKDAVIIERRAPSTSTGEQPDKIARPFRFVAAQAARLEWGSLFRIPKRVSTWDTRHGASSLTSNRLVPTRIPVVWGPGRETLPAIRFGRRLTHHL